MARIGGQRVWLSGGPSTGDPAVQQLAVGLQATTTWPTARYAGGSTIGSWGVSTLRAGAFSRAATTSDGLTDNVEGSDTGWLKLSPAGLRVLGGGASNTFIMQNGVLAVRAGSRNASTKGYMEIALFKDNAGVDPRNGVYQVFTANLRVCELTIDFDAGTYASSELGNNDVGTLAQDPTQPGIYIFQSSRVSGAINTARFRPIPDGLVGTFPFAGFLAPKPFIAARSFVTSRKELAGTYAGAVATEVAGTAYLAPAFRLKINPAGTTVQQCSLLPLSNCAAPAAEQPVGISDAQLSSFAGWTGGSTIWGFHVAKFGTRRVLLDATAPYGSDNILRPLLVVALAPITPQATWSPRSLDVFAGGGRIGLGTLTDSSWTAQLTPLSGDTSNFALPLQAAEADLGVRTGSANGEPHLVIQDGFFAIVLPQSGAANDLQIGVAP